MAEAALAPRAALGAFVLFCRIGGCLMLAPGFSNTQIPTQVRLFVALAVTLDADSAIARARTERIARR